MGDDAIYSTYVYAAPFDDAYVAPFGDLCPRSPGMIPQPSYPLRDYPDPVCWPTTAKRNDLVDYSNAEIVSEICYRLLKGTLSPELRDLLRLTVHRANVLLAEKYGK